ncbi:carbamoyltransferase [Saccharothrix sp. HUAS TT1]|uniref:carbamoyltransferase family protein n=1 Tax=unclassified Saccharothrix TaxID=2593673 RepID=UPI00345BC717
MLALGISGLDRSATFKAEVLGPGLTRERRIAQGFDSAAVLVDENGVVAASAQERHDGVKATGAFPRDAIEGCLRIAGVTMADIDVVAHGFRYEDSPLWQLDDNLRGWYSRVYAQDVQRETFTAYHPLRSDQEFLHVKHHLAHAASTYYPSGFEDALVLVADGMGESEATSVYTGRGGRLDLVDAHSALNSLGVLYGVVTHYLGFLINMDEYKVMGLAPYGDRRRYRAEFGEFLRLRPGGKIAVPLLSENKTPFERETHQGVVRRLEEALGPARRPGDEVEQRHMDIAATLQDSLERALLHVLREHRERTGLRKLCMAGGVALNCSANGVVLREGLFDEVFVQPASGDDGSALGAALAAVRRRHDLKPARMSMPYWGESFPAADVERALGSLGGGFTRERLDRADLVRRAVDLIRAGSVVALFQGAMEFGPRALGNRSILADPAVPSMRAHLNAVVKQREEFRPFAPAVPAEDASTYFDIPEGSERTFHHMLFVVPVRRRYREVLPAVTHVDGSARVQTVERGQSPLFWELLRETGDRSGIPVLVNTSFNLRGQPIVRTPEEAVATFRRSTLDALVIGDFLVRRDTAPDGAREVSDAGA